MSTGKVERGGDKPFHTVINAENFHALQTLLFTHRGKVDAIYIDPPYNTGAKDWKYNNDYVEGDDLYRHSKWLAFMERRLLLAKELLNPDDSVLIVTIDEKEYLRLGLLLEQTFPEARHPDGDVSDQPAGRSRDGEFSRVDEYIFFVFVRCSAQRRVRRRHARRARRSPDGDSVAMGSTLRGGNARRAGRGRTSSIRSIVDREHGRDRRDRRRRSPRTSIAIDAPHRTGCVAVWPIATDGTEMALGHHRPTAARSWLATGYVRGRRDTPTSRSTSSSST